MTFLAEDATGERWLQRHGFLAVDGRDEEEDLRAPLHVAASKGLLSVCQWLVSRGADLHCKDGNDSAPIHYACEAGATHLVRWMLDQGGGMHMLHQTNVAGYTPFLYSCRQESASLCRFLLARAALEGPEDLESVLWARSESRETGLHLAAEQGHPLVCREVCRATENDSLLLAVDEEGSTALHLAAANGHVAVVRELLSHPFSRRAVAALNSTGTAPLTVALRCSLREDFEAQVHNDTWKVLILHGGAEGPPISVAKLKDDDVVGRLRKFGDCVITDSSEAAMSTCGWTVDCPGKHGLVQHYVGIQEGWLCKRCYRVCTTYKESMQSCRECDFDICGSCVESMVAYDLSRSKEIPEEEIKSARGKVRVKEAGRADLFGLLEAQENSSDEDEDEVRSGGGGQMTANSTVVHTGSPGGGQGGVRTAMSTGPHQERVLGAARFLMQQLGDMPVGIAELNLWIEGELEDYSLLHEPLQMLLAFGMTRRSGSPFLPLLSSVTLRMLLFSYLGLHFGRSLGHLRIASAASLEVMGAFRALATEDEAGPAGYQDYDDDDDRGFWRTRRDRGY